MRELAEKLVALEMQIAAEKGRFVLFALFLRADAPDVWDLLVSAPWADKDRGDALRYLVEKLKAVASREEMDKVSRVAVLYRSHPVVEAVNRALGIEHGMAEVEDSIFDDVQIRHAYIITSRFWEP